MSNDNATAVPAKNTCGFRSGIERAGQTEVLVGEVEKIMARPPAMNQSGQTILACQERVIRKPTNGHQSAVFLDRDGTLIVDKPYLGTPDDVEILPGVVEGLLLLQDAGYVLIVTTNQSGVARGYFDVSAVGRVHDEVNRLLLQHDVQIAAFYFCPHHVDGCVEPWVGSCLCRKPGPGMLWQAAVDWSIDLSRSWIVGNARLDLEAGRAAGCAGYLVGPETGLGLADAARTIVKGPFEPQFVFPTRSI